MKIDAEAHSDDYHVSVAFDAAPWFAQADDAAILALAKIGWAGDYEADDVALFFQYGSTSLLFEYLGTRPTTGKDDPVGFECQINAAKAVAWVRANRPALVARLP